MNVLSPEREDAKVIPPHDAQAADCQGLGAVPLSENQGAQMAILGTCLVGIIQLGNPCEIGESTIDRAVSVEIHHTTTSTMQMRS